MAATRLPVPDSPESRVTLAIPADVTRRPLGDDLLVVLVLYRLPLEHSPAFCSLADAVGPLTTPLPLLVYDNSPEPRAAAPAVDSRQFDIRYVHDPTNPGVGRAYRMGAGVAMRASRRWMLLLDQDTELPPAALQRYAAAMAAHPSARLFAPVLRSAGQIVSPCAYRLKRGRPLRSITPGILSLAGRSILNSGMCISVDDYFAVGGHDARIGLDWSDHEFIARYKQRHATAVVVDVECQHSLFVLTPQTNASRLRRFHAYCRGARYTVRNPLDAIFTMGLVAARACLLAARHRSLQFLRVPFSILREGPR
jgi:rhamnosyltransferase